jgi:alkyl hydroperoxide reductase subunit AhpC
MRWQNRANLGKFHRRSGREQKRNGFEKNKNNYGVCGFMEKMGTRHQKKESKMRITLISMALLAAFALAKQRPEHSNRLALPEDLRGEIIPNFYVLESDNVNGLSLNSLKEKAAKFGAKRIVLSFFATYCFSCKEEFALLKKNAGELKKQGVMVYLINVGEDIDAMGKKVAKMVNDNAGKDFPYYFDPDVSSMRNFGLVNSKSEAIIPSTLILDKDLRALAVLVGEMGKDFPKILWGEL